MIRRYVRLKEEATQNRNGWAGTSLVLALYAAAATGSSAQTYTVLANLDKYTGGIQESLFQQGSLIQGADGNFYGTGTFSIYKATPKGSLTILHTFPNFQSLGNKPLVQALDGDFYGTTYQFGTNYEGSVFKISPQGKFKTLYSFCSSSGCPDGDYPDTGLVQGADGNLYGETLKGGAANSGTIFEVTPQGVLTTLYNFCPQPGCTDGFDGQLANGALVQGPDGDFYGTTEAGGIYNPILCGSGCGTVFKIGPHGGLTTLYTFCISSGCPDSAGPGGLVLGADGNFYGATGGDANEYGTVFQITPSGALTTIYNFCALPNCADGWGPYALIQGSDGNLYGVTANGGARNHGTVFRITPTGVLTTLYSFCSLNPAGQCPDGHNPSGLVQGTDGNFYGTTSRGGTEMHGVFFRLATGLGPA